MQRYRLSPHRQALLRGLLLVALAASASTAAWAALGQSPSPTAQRVSSGVSAARKLAIAPAGRAELFQSYDTLNDTGTTVREFTDAQGVVFALAWQGPVLPDLRTLLGDYHASFQTQAEQIRKTGRRSASLRVATDGLVLQSNGRMRNFSGFAYAPALVPQGVQIEALAP